MTTDSANEGGPLVESEFSDSVQASGEPEDTKSDGWMCPIPMSHDRFREAHYFLHRMEKHYHEPNLFRYNLNAFIAALRATHEMLQKEFEKAGQVAWWNERRQEFKSDLVLARFARGRNIALHQRALLSGSRVTIGLFRNRQLKLAVQKDMQTDEPSESLLRRVLPHFIGFILDEDHEAIGEQIGVRRLYFVKDLSEDEDVLRAARRALARSSNALADAHNYFGGEQVPIPDEDVLDIPFLDRVTVLLEMDIDPDAPERWGWLDPPTRAVGDVTTE
jgi:hypothetical protein